MALFLNRKLKKSDCGSVDRGTFGNMQICLLCALGEI